MSIKLMQIVMDSKTETPAEKLVLLIVANYADDDGANIFPSKRTLADKTGLDERTVQRICAKLVETKVLLVVREAIRQPTVYRLDVGALTPLETYRRAAGRPQKQVQNVPAPVQDDPGPHAKDPGVTPPNPSITTTDPPPEGERDTRVADDAADDLKGTVVVTPSWAADWPVLHVEGGDYVVKEPYASCPAIREGMVEWITRRLTNPKKKLGLPTLFGLTRTNCGWWDKYPLSAVVHAVEKAAAEGWQGIIEDVARNWKPSPGDTSSVTKTVQHNVQTMANTMEARQAMILAAAAKVNGVLIHGNGQLALTGASDERDS